MTRQDSPSGGGPDISRGAEGNGRCNNREDLQEYVKQMQLDTNDMGEHVTWISGVVERAITRSMGG